MDDVAVALEHVHLLDGLDGLHVHFLKCGLQFLVICTRALVHFLRLASRGAFASTPVISLVQVKGRVENDEASEVESDMNVPCSRLVKLHSRFG